VKNIQETLHERGKTHGVFPIQAACSQALKSLVQRDKDKQIDMRLSQCEALEMICMKMSRIVHGDADEADHWRDIAGYATLVVKELTHDA